jgi:PAS domain S-box-containing protein
MSIERAGAGPRRAAWTIDRTTLWRWLLVFLVTLAGGVLGIKLLALGARVRLVLLPSGFAVAATTRWGRRMWPAVLAAGIAIDAVMDTPWIAALGTGIGFAGAAALTAWLLERQGFDPNFGRSRDVLVFLGAAALGMTLAPTLGMLGMWLADHQRASITPVNWLRWWGHLTTGVLLVTPLLISTDRHSIARLRSQWISGALWLSAVLATMAAILFAPAPLGRPPIAVVALMLIMFSAIRFGLTVAAAGTLLLTATTAYSVAFGRGVFGVDDELMGLVTLWSFAGALVSICLMATALLAERDAAGAARLRAERSYAKIFEDSPQPLWVHDPASRRFLLVNEAAVRQYGWSREQFQTQGIEALAAGEQPVVPPADAEHASTPGAEPFETHHRARDGRVLDVEVWTCSIDLDGRAAELVFAVDVTERRALGRAVLEAITGEQRRIGQEMHDGLGQELTGLSLSLRALAIQGERAGLAMAADISGLADMVAGCIESTRRIVRGLSPLSDADGNLQNALEALAESSSRSGTLVSFSPRLDAPLVLALETRAHLLRIAQEAVQNALKHSGASHVDLELWVRPSHVTLTIEDDGQGLVQRNGVAGLGMRTMRFRAAAVGGRLRVGRRRGGGTAIVCDAPQPQPRAVPA